MVSGFTAEVYTSESCFLHGRERLGGSRSPLHLLQPEDEELLHLLEAGPGDPLVEACAEDNDSAAGLVPAVIGDNPLTEERLIHLVQRQVYSGAQDSEKHVSSYAKYQQVNSGFYSNNG